MDRCVHVPVCRYMQVLDTRYYCIMLGCVFRHSWPCSSFKGAENLGGVAPSGQRLRIFSWVPGVAWSFDGR